MYVGHIAVQFTNCLKGGMHGQNRDTGIQSVNITLCHISCHSSAAASVHLTQFSHLPGHVGLVQNSADKLIKYEDGKEEKLTLPKSLVIKYIFEDGGWFVLRPSGTEPKLKIYISVKDETKEKALSFVEQLKAEIDKIVENL